MIKLDWGKNGRGEGYIFYFGIYFYYKILANSSFCITLYRWRIWFCSTDDTLRLFSPYYIRRSLFVSKMDSWKIGVCVCVWPSLENTIQAKVRRSSMMIVLNQRKTKTNTGPSNVTLLSLGCLLFCYFTFSMFFFIIIIIISFIKTHTNNYER